MFKNNQLLNWYFKKASLPVFFHVFLRYIMAPLEEVEKYIPQCGRILDFGCGHGTFSYLMYFSSIKREIVGLDVDRNKINIAKAINPNNKNIVFTDRDINDFKNKEFDAVVINDVLYLMPYAEQNNLLKSIHNVLKDDAVLIIKTMDPRSKLKFFCSYIQEFISVNIIKITKSKEGKFYFVKDLNHFKQILQEAGFHTQEFKLDRGFLHPHILLLCHKKLNKSF
ncbi:MAG: class I SAM-dependent methyltransferase [Candidatus Omnitrophota bacterium]|nr:class I SAM-dependent methyltransferase [Candidatus Omnitrophota bacterium]